MERLDSLTFCLAAPRNTWCDMHLAPFWLCRAMNGRCPLQQGKNSMRNRAMIILTAIALAGSPIAVESAKPKANAAALKPLTYANVVSFFKEARFRPVEVQKRC